MLVKMLNGNIEDVYDYVGKSLIARGIAKELKNEAVVEPSTERKVEIEMAVAEPKAEHAVLKFFRTERSKRLDKLIELVRGS